MERNKGVYPVTLRLKEFSNSPHYFGDPVLRYPVGYTVPVMSDECFEAAFPSSVASLFII